MWKKKEDKKSEKPEEIMKPMPVFSSYNKTQSEMILAAFETNGIPAYKQSLGAGQMVNIYMGSPVAGEEIFVDEGDASRAIDVLTAIGMLNEDEEPPATAGYSKKTMWLARAAIVLVFAIIIIGFVIAYMNV